MSKSVEFGIVDIHNPDDLALFGQKLVIVEGKETIVEMTDDEMDEHFGEVLPDELRDTPRAKG